jgi:hypothetical protein
MWNEVVIHLAWCVLRPLQFCDKTSPFFGKYSTSPNLNFFRTIRHRIMQYSCRFCYGAGIGSWHTKKRIILVEPYICSQTLMSLRLWWLRLWFGWLWLRGFPLRQFIRHNIKNHWKKTRTKCPWKSGTPRTLEKKLRDGSSVHGWMQCTVDASSNGHIILGRKVQGCNIRNPYTLILKQYLDLTVLGFSKKNKGTWPVLIKWGTGVQYYELWGRRECCFKL